MMQFDVTTFSLNPAQMQIFERLVQLTETANDFTDRAAISADMGGEAGHRIFTDGADEKLLEVEQTYLEADAQTQAAFDAWKRAVSVESLT